MEHVGDYKALWGVSYMDRFQLECLTEPGGELVTISLISVMLFSVLGV